MMIVNIIKTSEEIKNKVIVLDSKKTIWRCPVLPIAYRVRCAYKALKCIPKFTCKKIF